MAEHGTLQIGDTVTHGDWPNGVTAKVLGFSNFKRGGWVKGRYRVKDDPSVRIAHVCVAISTKEGSDDAWMEAGLVKVNA